MEGLPRQRLLVGDAEVRRLGARRAAAAVAAFFLAGVCLAGEATWRSEHFVMRTDLRGKTARRLLDELEALRPRHLAGMRLVDSDAPQVRLFVFKTRAGFNAAARRYSAKAVGAVGLSTSDGVLAYYSSRRKCLAVLMHELTHAYFRSAGVRPALWLNEGLACYFGDLRFTPRKVVFGVIGPGRLAALRVAMYSDRYVPLRALLRAGKPQFYIGRPADGKTPNLRERLIYTEAAAFVHFLKCSRAPEVAGKFDAFLDKFYQTGDTQAAFEAVYGIDYAALETRWRAYVETLLP